MDPTLQLIMDQSKEISAGQEKISTITKSNISAIQDKNKRRSGQI
jgi:hypothetical protein